MCVCVGVREFGLVCLCWCRVCGCSFSHVMQNFLNCFLILLALTLQLFNFGNFNFEIF